MDHFVRGGDATNPSEANSLAAGRRKPA